MAWQPARWQSAFSDIIGGGNLWWLWPVLGLIFGVIGLTQTNYTQLDSFENDRNKYVTIYPVAAYTPPNETQPIALSVVSQERFVRDSSRFGNNRVLDRIDRLDLVDGELVVSPRPATPHAFAHAAVDRIDFRADAPFDTEALAREITLKPGTPISIRELRVRAASFHQPCIGRAEIAIVLPRACDALTVGPLVDDGEVVIDVPPLLASPDLAAAGAVAAAHARPGAVDHLEPAAVVETPLMFEEGDAIAIGGDARVTDIAAGFVQPCPDRVLEAIPAIAEVAHDLKAPLSVISLEISLIEARLQQPELYESVIRIQQNIDHVDRMIDKLLRERLATDATYRNAASNLAAQDREDEVARELTDYVYGTYEVD